VNNSDKSKVEIAETALLIRVSQKYRDGMSSEALYEVTRGVWVIGARRNNVQYALSVVHGVVQEVYAVKSWYPAATTPYKTRDFSDVNCPGRWEFLGEIAPAVVREKYLGKSVAHYFKIGAANPIMYINA